MARAAEAFPKFVAARVIFHITETPMRSLIFIAVLLFSSTALAHEVVVVQPRPIVRRVVRSVLVYRVRPAIVVERPVVIVPEGPVSYGFMYAGERRLWFLRRVR